MVKTKSIIFIVGPTAVGKTEAAVNLAVKINAEIISCDSMQIYKGMDILTSKPPVILRKKVKHHLIGVVPLSKEYDVSLYRASVIRKIKAIFKAGKVPLLVGGTGLYVSMLADGIFDEKAKNELMRKGLYRLSAKMGSVYLYKKLEKVDPEAAARIHFNDARRIIRALEVFKATGKPISLLQKQRRGLKDEYRVKIFCLNMNRDKLYKRIDERVEKMFEQGLLREVSGLIKKPLSKTASCAIGIKELKGYLKGEYDLAEAKRLIQRNSRHYAKRQLSWFRKNKSIKWINITDKDTPSKVTGKIWKELS